MSRYNKPAASQLAKLLGTKYYIDGRCVLLTRGRG